MSKMRKMLRFVALAAFLVLAGGVVGLTTPTIAAKPPKPGSCGGQFCGGFAGIRCPEGFTCVDNPCDDCNPKTGGADCGGLCKQ